MSSPIKQIKKDDNYATYKDLRDVQIDIGKSMAEMEERINKRFDGIMEILSAIVLKLNTFESRFDAIDKKL